MGMDFRGHAGLKTGVKNEIFWSEIGSGFGEPDGTPPARILGRTSRVKKQIFSKNLSLPLYTLRKSAGMILP